MNNKDYNQFMLHQTYMFHFAGFKTKAYFNQDWFSMLSYDDTGKEIKTSMAHIYLGSSNSALNLLSSPETQHIIDIIHEDIVAIATSLSSPQPVFNLFDLLWGCEINNATKTI